LRNFRLAEEHWNYNPNTVAVFPFSLRNFRLAEEHWNQTRSAARSARWSNWGIFGSLKSTETLKTLVLSKGLQYIEEFSARWRALKRSLFRMMVTGFFIEEFSARWRALKHQSGEMSISGYIIEEFSARWRALKLPTDVRQVVNLQLRNFRLAEEHWNFIP